MINEFVVSVFLIFSLIYASLCERTSPVTTWPSNHTTELSTRVRRSKERVPTWRDCKKFVRQGVLVCYEKGFTTVPTGIFETKFRDIYLNRNPYVCDCKMQWFLDGLRKYGVRRIVDRFSMECAKPAKFRWQRIMYIYNRGESFCDDGKKSIKSDRVPTWKDCFLNRKDEVNCAHQGFTTIPVGVLDQTNYWLFLSKNPYVCDCKMQWFIDKLRDFKSYRRHKSIPDKKYMRCGAPKEFDGRRIVDIVRSGISLCPAGSRPVIPPHCSRKPPVCNETSSMCIQDNAAMFHCKCRQGFRKSSKKNECQDVDECVTDTSHTCDKTTSLCVNTFGSYKCSCKTGFEKNKEGKTCVKVKNRCLQKPHPCNQTTSRCVNDGAGKFQCKCHNGYHKSSTVNKCEERKRCSEKPYPCDKTSSTCVNGRLGDFHCKCREGFQKSENLERCEAAIERAKSSSLIIVVVVSVVAVVVFLGTLAILLVKRNRANKQGSFKEEQSSLLNDDDNNVAESWNMETTSGLKKENESPMKKKKIKRKETEPVLLFTGRFDDRKFTPEPSQDSVRSEDSDEDD